MKNAFFALYSEFKPKIMEETLTNDGLILAIKEEFNIFVKNSVDLSP